MKKFTVIFCAIILAFTALNVAGCATTKANIVYEIDMELSDEMVLTAEQKVEYTNKTQVALKDIKFNLFANAYRNGAKYMPADPLLDSAAFPHGASFGGITITEVEVNGRNAEILITGEDQNILTVPFFNELYPDERVVIEIEYEVKLANVISRTGYNDSTINLANFYPKACVYEDGFYECVYYSYGDPFYSECADYKVKVTLPTKYVLASSGVLTNKDVDGDKCTHEYELNSARSFALVASENFKVESIRVNDTDIYYYYYNDGAPKDSLAYAKKSMEYFSKTFGKYPYKTYSVVQTEFMEGGMEYAGLVMISDELAPNSYGEVIVHETAHQWWQVCVGNNEIEHGFLDESLAEYSVVMFYENYPEYSLTRESLMKNAEQTYKIYCSVSEKLFGDTDTTMIRSLPQFNGEYEYVNIAYIKGCIMFDCLRQTIGDGDFIAGLKKYYADYSFKISTPDDLSGTFEKTGADTNGFFASFYDGKVIL